MEQFLLDSERIIHLDFKKCPLKVDYLKQVFKLLSSWQATGLLIEWEDAFPYVGDLVDIGSNSSSTPYTQLEITEILENAKENNLSIIPLVQVFGHLEFVLKTAKWRHLREIPKYCSSMCPSKDESFSLVTMMIDQILNLHPGVKFIHIGGDEVWHLGLCSLCTRKTKSYVFMEHITKVAKYVKEKYPDVKSIMWDDMLRGIDENILQEFEIGKYVEPMVWDYNSVSHSITDCTWEKYGNIFKNIWIASAFKGATGCCQIKPIIGHHIQNHNIWLNVVKKIQSTFSRIRGIAMTGWSRYDHYAVLCELLPTAFPSLALCLRIWISGGFDDTILQDISSILGFTKEYPIQLGNINRSVDIRKYLNFPAYQIYHAMEWLTDVRVKFNNIVYGDQTMTWLNTWQVKRNNTSTMQVEHILTNSKNLFEELIAIEEYFRANMPMIFYPDTIEEWLGCNVFPLHDKIREMINNAEGQIKLEL